MIHGDKHFDTFVENVMNASKNLNAFVDFKYFYSDLEGLMISLGKCSQFSIIIFYEQLNIFYLDFSNVFDVQLYNSFEVELSNTELQECFSHRKAFYVDEANNRHSLKIGDEVKVVTGAEPLVYKNQVYGLLVLHESVKNQTIDRLWIRILANLASSAIINLQLYEETNREAIEHSAKLGAINSAGELLSHMDLDTLMVKIMGLVLDIINGQVGSIMLLDEENLVTKVEWGLKDEVIKKINHFSGIPLVEHTMNTKEPFLTTDIFKDERIDKANIPVGLESLIIIPLYTNDRFLGVVNIINARGSQDSITNDMELLVTMTSLVSISIENALLYADALEQERMKEQLNIARKIQQDLLPQEELKYDDLDIAAINIMCDETGGDYYDYFSSAPDEYLNIVVGDVSGHGLGAAVYMAIARAHIRSLSDNISNISDAMMVINKTLVSDMEKHDQFITLFLMTLDVNLKVFQYVSAGHERILLYRVSEDRFIFLESTGLPLGLFDESEYREDSCQLIGGDILFLYTDGLKEMMNEEHELYGLERMKKGIKKYASLSSEQIRDNIIKDAVIFAGDEPSQDDVTVIVIKVKDTVGNITTLSGKTPFIYLEDELPQIEGNKIYHKSISSTLDAKENLLEELIIISLSMIEYDEQIEFAIRLSLDEMLTNGIVHGNGSDPSKKLDVSLYKGINSLSFCIKDEGNGFDESQIDVSDSPGEWYKESGRGVFLIGKMMDDVCFFNGGSGVLMTKYVKLK